MVIVEAGWALYWHDPDCWSLRPRQGVHIDESAVVLLGIERVHRKVRDRPVDEQVEAVRRALARPIREAQRIRRAVERGRRRWKRGPTRHRQRVPIIHGRDVAEAPHAPSKP